MQTPTLLVDSYCQNAEGVLWHSLEQRLYWTDIPAGEMFCYDFRTETCDRIYSGEPVGGFTIQSDGSLLLFKARGAIDRWHRGEITPIAQLPEAQDSRFNDVIADPAGRVFCGTVGTDDRPGNLYRMEQDLSLTLVWAGLDMPNGMGFSPDRQQFYLTVSDQQRIYRFDYAQEQGELSDPQVYLTTPAEEGVPDGMTIDAQGYLWSARWDGGHLFRYAPDGSEVLRIPFPARKVTCVTFGGADYRELFITTAGGDDRSAEGKGAGAIFRLDLGIQGVPEFFSKIAIG